MVELNYMRITTPWCIGHNAKYDTDGGDMNSIPPNMAQWGIISYLTEGHGAAPMSLVATCELSGGSASYGRRFRAWSHMGAGESAQEM